MKKELMRLNFVKKLRKLLSSEESVIILVFVVIMIIISAILPQFRTLYNILIVSRQFSLIAIVAFGQAVVLITGGFDLSVGYIVALSNMVVGYLIIYQGWPIWISILAAIFVGTACGLFNGLLVGKVKINPLIATLASGWIFQGIILVTTKGWPITGLSKYSSFSYLGQGYLLKIPVPIWLMLTTGIILTFFLQKSIYGRFLYAIGGNEKASWVAGLNVSNLRILSFMISGTLSGFAGVLLASRLGTAQVNSGALWTLPTVAAAVIGGVSLAGGKGKIYGVLIGAAFLGTINNILVLMKISAYWQSLISGFVLITAVSFDALRRKRENI